MNGGIFCGNGTNFATLRGLLAQFLQAWNSANPGTPGGPGAGCGRPGCDQRQYRRL